MIKNAFYFSLSLLRIGGGGEWGWEGGRGGGGGGQKARLYQFFHCNIYKRNN